MASTAEVTRVKMAQASALDFDALFAQHWGRVYAILLSLTGDPADAEDLALEVFWRLYRYPPRDIDSGKLFGWLYRVATNLGYNALRAARRRSRYEQNSGLESIEGNFISDPAVQAEGSVRRQQVRLVLAQMKPRSAHLLVLRYSGFSYAEIASVLKVAPGSIGTLLARAEREFESLLTARYGTEF